MTLSASACSSAPAPPPPAPVARHLLFITIDTLRADRLGCYGNTQVATPEIDRIAREGALALNTAAHVPLTRPSHLSMFTGRYPSEHGIRDNVSPSFVWSEIPTLAEVLHDAGFQTACVGVIDRELARQSGLNRGFDTYADGFASDAPDGLFLNTIQKRGDETTREALNWLHQTRVNTPSKRLALWVHLYDPHDPYEPPEP